MRLAVILFWTLADITLLAGADDLDGECRFEYANSFGNKCLNDYNQTFSCVLDSTGPCPTENTLCWLEFSSEYTQLNCSLQNTRNCTAFGDDSSFEEYSVFDIFLCMTRNGQTNKELIIQNYRSMCNIKPVTPHNLTVHRRLGGYFFTWDHGYFDKLVESLEYELLVYKNGHHNPNCFRPMNNSYYIKDENLEPNEMYVAKVRSKSKSPYDGPWSEDSKAVRWNTTRTHGSNILLPFGKLDILLYLVAALFFFVLFFSFTARQKLKAFSKIPTPAPYFQPLYKIYKGNFQNWLVHPSYMGDCKMDELLKIDTLIEAKPISNEESFQPLPPHFPRCQAPYVCYDDKDCTVCDQNDCPSSPEPPSVQKINMDDMQNIQSQDLSDTDCKDLTFSLDSNESQGIPSKELESPGYHDDYCTLSDTPNGLVPTVMVTKISEKSREAECSQILEMDLNATG
ncbi:interleukin 21 receptor, tandem duplicate 2 [Brienomyrus brachyistius]|uniref:interleukin 21 receptor, tandem duplicate 2 n=1 Tax=Brienomyrus brachyistius TaxID=42636 RepID=UPI0020B2597F|nr:interleukin 21 receptor, tandem duplicate 2 [Brienomyrus brachyistius]